MQWKDVACTNSSKIYNSRCGLCQDVNLCSLFWQYNKLCLCSQQYRIINTTSVWMQGNHVHCRSRTCIGQVVDLTPYPPSANASHVLIHSYTRRCRVPRCPRACGFPRRVGNWTCRGCCAIARDPQWLSWVDRETYCARSLNGVRISVGRFHITKPA